MILQAPVTFIVAVIIIFGLVWQGMNWTYSTQIEDLKSRISLRDDQLSDYKNKLNGATPDEAKKRLDSLELQVKSILPRRLTDAQKSKLKLILSVQAGTITIAQDMAVADAKAFSGDLASTFQSAGWRTILPGIMGVNVVPPTGVALQVQNQASLSPLEALTKKALEDAGIAFDILGDSRPLGRTDGSNLNPDVSLLITTKLN